jgi:hypothetical protein
MSVSPRPKFTPKPGNGSLFKNNLKDKENQPDYTGTCTLPDGSPGKLAAWLKADKNGVKFMSLKISHEDEQYRDAAQPVNPQAPLDDEIPF